MTDAPNRTPSLTYSETLDSDLMLHPIMLSQSMSENEFTQATQTLKETINFLQDDCLHHNLPETDIFAFAFLTLSRYEEYLDFDSDLHGRFTSQSSILKKYNAIKLPIVDHILLWFATYVNEKFGIELTLVQQQSTEITFDIDHLWKYKHKTALLSIGGYFKDLVKLDLKSAKERYQTLKSPQQIDSYDLSRWEHYIDFSKVKFFVLMNERTQYDKGISPKHPKFIEKINQLAATSDVGIHPGYQTSEKQTELTKQLSTYHSILSNHPKSSRQHYLRFNLPKTFRWLIDAGIEEEYSMGYADEIGFRAGTSRTFLWYDLESDCETILTMHPFAAMDVTLTNYLSLDSDESFTQLSNLIEATSKVGGTCRMIWHNSSPFWEERWNPYLKTFQLFEGSK